MISFAFICNVKSMKIQIYYILWKILLFINMIIKLLTKKWLKQCRIRYKNWSVFPSRLRDERSGCPIYDFFASLPTKPSVKGQDQERVVYKNNLPKTRFSIDTPEKDQRVGFFVNGFSLRLCVAQQSFIALLWETSVYFYVRFDSCVAVFKH